LQAVGLVTRSRRNGQLRPLPRNAQSSMARKTCPLRIRAIASTRSGLPRVFVLVYCGNRRRRASAHESVV